MHIQTCNHCVISLLNIYSLATEFEWMETTEVEGEGMEGEEKGSQVSLVESSVPSRGEREGEGYSMEVAASNMVEDLSALPVEAFESELSTSSSISNSQIQRQGQLNGFSATAAPPSDQPSSSNHHSIEVEGSEVREREGQAAGDQCKSGTKQRRVDNKSGSKHNE